MANERTLAVGVIIAIVAVVVNLLSSVPAAGLVGSGEVESFTLSPQEQCHEGLPLADAGSLDVRWDGRRCVLRASTAEGSLDAFFGLNSAIDARIQQPPEFFGFFREAEVTANFLVPAAPPAETSVVAVQLLNHLIIVWIFEPDGVAVVPLGDPILHYLPPAPPPYFAGFRAGKVRYGEPFHVTVGMTGENHIVTVRQQGDIVAAATLKKIFPHPDRMTHASVFLVSGNLRDYPIWAFEKAQFRGVHSPAEVVIASEVQRSQDVAIRRVELAGNEARVFVS